MEPQMNADERGWASEGRGQTTQDRRLAIVHVIVHATDSHRPLIRRLHRWTQIRRADGPRKTRKDAKEEQEEGTADERG